MKMMKWRPWPPLSYKKFDVKILVQKVKGLNFLLSESGDEKNSRVLQDYGRTALEVKWKGSKGNGLSLSSFKKSIKGNFTKEESLRQDGVVEWNEEFQSVCNFAAHKEGSFHPWKVIFTVFNVSSPIGFLFSLDSSTTPHPQPEICLALMVFPCWLGKVLSFPSATL